jgi:predicted dehydrogenase
MKQIETVLIGASSYGGYYINQFRDAAVSGARICAVVDPFISSSPNLEWIRENNIPVFDRLEDFYKEGHADLVLIISPIQFHRQQAETAIEHGSAVLCEKPICAGAADAIALLKVWEKAGTPFGVGFQWSYSPGILELKQDILNGLFGRPLSLKTMVSWPRGDAYFDLSSWKGKRRDKDGNAVNDSIVMNAAAHYLHNMLFVLGDKMDTAACLKTISGSLYRARNIETFDTCFLRGTFTDGCTMQFCASHTAQRRIDPILEYRFEKGTVSFDENIDGILRASFSDGKVKEYGEPQSDAMRLQKLVTMVEPARTGERVMCGIRTVIPHLLVCDAILEGMDITDFPQTYKVRNDKPPGVFIKGLDEVMETFYQTGAMPDSVSWSAPERTVALKGLG